MNSAPKPPMTPEEYLEFEAHSEEKHEYFQGEVFAMSGVSVNHSYLQGNLAGILYAQRRKTNIHLFPSTLKIHVETTGLYTYPDLSVVHGDLRLEGNYAILNPTLLVEVLSPTSEAYDRGDKFAMYRQIPSLKQYMLISQERAQVEVFTRQADGSWTFYAYTGTDAIVPLTSIDCELPCAELYEGVTLTPQPLHAHA